MILKKGGGQASDMSNGFFNTKRREKKLIKIKDFLRRVRYVLGGYNYSLVKCTDVAFLR